MVHPRICTRNSRHKTLNALSSTRDRKQGRCPRIDVLMFIVHAMTKLALDNFQAHKQRFQMVNDLVGESMAFIYKSTKAPDHQVWQVKTIMWSLRGLAHWMQAQDRYAETNIVARFAPDSAIGVGEIVRGNELAHRKERPPNPEIFPAPHFRSRAKRQENDNEVLITDYKVLEEGLPFRYYDICRLFYDALLERAQHRLDVPTEVVQHDRRTDLYLVIIPTSREAEENLRNEDVIKAIEGLAQAVALVEPLTLRFKPSRFLVRKGGRIIGKGLIQVGRH